MKRIIMFLVATFLRVALWFRYRVKVKGLENLTKEALSKPGGILFLPNHPAVFVDPAVVTIALLKKFALRPMIVEYMYYTPVVHWVAKMLDSLPVPNFDASSNSLKRRRGEKVIRKVVDALEKGDNFLIYPSGRVKHTGLEVIGGASGVHSILEQAPDTNIVLVRTKGLWGSSFSRALIGQSPPMFATVWEGFKKACKNLLFFTPRREVIVEFYPAPADFPYHAKRTEFNHYLERWYNQPDGLTEQEGEYPGDSLVLVSYSCWKKDLPEVYQPEKEEIGEKVDLASIPEEVKSKTFAKLSELAEQPIDAIKPEMTLASDLGLDSLDNAELLVFLKDEFDVDAVPISELTTVGKVLAIGAKQIIFGKEAEEEITDTKLWKQPIHKYQVQIAHGKTLPEVFLNNCARMGNRVACADARVGIMTYPKLKMRALILAEYIRHLPGKYIGILLPASVASFLTIFACHIAGKVPLMINWTIGPRHLQSIIKLSKVEAILSSWAFLDRLESVDLADIDDMLIMLEDVGREITLKDKLLGLIRSKYSTKRIMKTFGIDQLTEEDEGGLLFTSGTESMPKGVPLTHNNILTNQRGALEILDLYSDDVVYSFLPPFHSFGFTLSGMIGILSGIRTVYSPDPTDGPGLAKAMGKWGVTIVCGAPTFLKSMVKSADAEQFKTLRLCFTGAERTPPELSQLLGELGKEQCLLEGYGITECSPVIAANRVGQPLMGVGKAIPGVELCIVHPETDEVLETGKEGLILTRGPNVFKGYINPGLAKPFVEVNGKSWYRTGDLGSLDKEGNLTISGRLKRFIKVGGEMISLPALEEAMLDMAQQRGWSTTEEGPALAICAKEVAAGKPEIHLFSRFKISTDEANQTLRDAGFSNLVKITHTIQLPEIPVMGTGKIFYRKLEEQICS